jgi:hypothetical protein
VERAPAQAARPAPITINSISPRVFIPISSVFLCAAVLDAQLSVQKLPLHVKQVRKK